MRLRLLDCPVTIPGIRCATSRLRIMAFLTRAQSAGVTLGKQIKDGLKTTHDNQGADKMNTRLITLSLALALHATTALTQTPPAVQAKDLMTKALAGIAGKEAAVLTVEYAPGASSARHRHNGNTFVYVLEGAVEMQVDGGPLVKLAAGETFYENPTDIHAVSRNASATQPAKILVFMVKDVGRPRTEPVK